MFCTSCGSNITDGAAFCTNCGQAVNGPTPQNQYGVPPQSPPPAVKKTKSKAPVIIAVAAAIAAVIVAVVIIAGIRNSAMSPWEGYVSFEDFARAAEIDDILSVGVLNEQGFYALMGGAFVGSIFEPIINAFITGMGLYDTDVKVTAEVDLVNGSKLSQKYHVPPELRQNYNYLVRRTGIGGSKTYLALHFDGERVFGVSIPYSGWIVMVYEEGALIKY